MITTSDEPGSGSRIVRIAIVASVLVHATVLALALLANAELERLLARVVPVPVPTPPQTDEIITISSATRYALRPTPVAPAKPQQTAPKQPVNPQPVQPPAQAHPAVVERPAYGAPALLRHELAKQDDRAPSQPKTSTTAPPRPDQPGQLAFTQPSRPSQPHQGLPHFTRTQLQQLQNDFQKTILQTRSDVNPLKVSPDPAAAPKRYRIQLEGLFGHMRHGEGIYFPVKGWRSGGLDYYYVSYEFTYADGTFEKGDVPWPIHFAPDADPFVSQDASLLRHTPLPGPPAGFVPPGDLGKALRGFFPDLHFEDDGVQP
jgi:hypothetical protein